MPSFPSNSQSDRTPDGLTWGKSLAQIPTVFGRLAFLASLRDPATGRYSHEALVRLLGSEEADRTLCSSHHQVFSEWLRYSLAEQKADLQEYLTNAGSPSLAMQYRSLLPPNAREAERQLYLTDLEILLEWLKF